MDLVHTWLMGFASFVTGVVGFTVMIIAILGLDPLLAVVGLACVPPLVVINTVLFPKWFGAANADLSAAHGARADAVEELLSASAAGTVAATYRELVTAREMLQTNNGVGGWRQRFLADSEHRYQAARRTQKSLFIISLSRVVQGLTTVVLLLLGGWLAADGQISVGTVVVFILATRQLFDSATQASNLVGQLQLTKVVLARLLDLLTTTAPRAAEPAPHDAPHDAAVTDLREPTEAAPEPAPADPPAPMAPPRQIAAGTAPTRSTVPERGDLDVRDVRYSYVADAEVLHGLSVSIQAGDRVALIGPTGAGKTTLAKLITGLYTPDAGSVSYAGLDLRALPPGELRRRVVLVPQRVHLISGTLQDSRAGPPKTRSDRPWPASAWRTGWPACRTAWRPGSTAARADCRPARCSWSAWYGRPWSTPPCWSWTRPRPTSTHEWPTSWRRPSTYSAPTAP